MKILLTGNSFIYKGNEATNTYGPASVFERLAKEGGHDVEMVGTYIGGSVLSQHWNDTNGINPREELNTGEYDLHIIAGGNSGSFDGTLDNFADLAAANGTDVMLYGLWIPDYMADATSNAFTTKIHNQYTAAAERNDGFYSPNGMAYRDVYDQITAKAGDNGQTAEDILTYDGIHASPYGAYIVASVLYATVFGEKAPTSWRPPGISDADAKIAQDAAWKAFNAYAISYDGGDGSSSAPTKTVTPTYSAPSNDASIDGKVFVDDDGNNYDDGDAGLAGVTVSLYNLGSNRVVATTETDSGGKYSFDNLAGGNYQVRFADVANSSYVKPGVGSEANDSDLTSFWSNGGGATGTINLSAGENMYNVDAGVTKPSGSSSSSDPTPTATESSSSGGSNKISGRAFVDSDGDGRDEGDAGVAGVTVQLWAEGSGIVATTTTASNGSYSFSGLDAGKYAVRFAGVDKADPTKANAYSNDAIDSDAINTWSNGTSTTRVFTLLDGKNETDVDIGYVFQHSTASSTSYSGGTSSSSSKDLTGDGSANNITGTNSGEKIYGYAGNDRITGNGGNDVINGGSGADMIFAGGGNDTITFDNADTMVFGGGGNDTFVFNGGTFEFNNLRLESVETFDLSNGTRDTITISADDVRQAEGMLIIEADSGDKVNLDTTQSVRQVGSKTIDGEVYDQYVIGSGGYQKFYIDDDASLTLV